MLSINPINCAENNYLNTNKSIPFKSRFVPNKTLKDAFHCASVHTNSSGFVRPFAHIMEYLLNDGKDSLIELTRNKSGGSVLKIDGKRVNYYHSSLDDDWAPIINLINYYICKNKFVFDSSKLTAKELKLVQPKINNLNAELNADDITKNPDILTNLSNNLADIKISLDEYSHSLLSEFEKKIFG